MTNGILKVLVSQGEAEREVDNTDYSPPPALGMELANSARLIATKP
jgi:hypothetical protein